MQPAIHNNKLGEDSPSTLEVTIQSGSAELIASGTAMSLTGRNITLSINLGVTGVVLVFELDERVISGRFESTGVFDTNKIKINIGSNVENKEPLYINDIRLGKYNGMSIYLCAQISSIVGKVFMLNYCIYSTSELLTRS